MTALAEEPWPGSGSWAMPSCPRPLPRLHRFPCDLGHPMRDESKEGFLNLIRNFSSQVRVLDLLHECFFVLAMTLSQYREDDLNSSGVLFQVREGRYPAEFAIRKRSVVVAHHNHSRP